MTRRPSWHPVRPLAALLAAVVVGATLPSATLATTPIEAVRDVARPLEPSGAAGAAGRVSAGAGLAVGAVVPDGAVDPDAPFGPGAVPVATAASELQPGRVDRATSAMTATYAVEARLSVAARVLRGSVAITARNDSPLGVDRVRLNTTMAALGRLVLSGVSVDGIARAATIDDQTVTVPFGGVLPPGGTVVVRLAFRATLRSGTSGDSWLLTRANGITDLYRWVPWVSRATRFARPNFGDPFVTPVSPLVTLRLHTDAVVRHVVNGRRTSISSDRRTTTWRLEHVRDVVVNAAADYRVTRRTVGDTPITVFTRPNQASAGIADAAVNAVRRLEPKLGPYPYPALRIVQSAGGYGMEGPGVVWIPGGVAPGNLRYLLMHEVAHQWFYGQVGNDQAREPFADEAITDMVARYLTGTRRSSRCSAGALDRSIYAYRSCYYERVYIQGGNLLDDARVRMGSATFFGALRRYLVDHRWQLVHTRTLLDALDAATPRDLASWWRSRFPTLY